MIKWTKIIENREYPNETKPITLSKGIKITLLGYGFIIWFDKTFYKSKKGDIRQWNTLKENGKKYKEHQILHK